MSSDGLAPYAAALSAALPAPGLWELGPVRLAGPGEPPTRCDELLAQYRERTGLGLPSLSSNRGRGHRAPLYYLHMLLPTLLRGGELEPVLAWLAPSDPPEDPRLYFLLRGCWCVSDPRGDALLGALRTDLTRRGHILPGTGQWLLPEGPLASASSQARKLLGLPQPETHMRPDGRLFLRFEFELGWVSLEHDPASNLLLSAWIPKDRQGGSQHGGSLGPERVLSSPPDLAPQLVYQAMSGAAGY